MCDALAEWRSALDLGLRPHTKLEDVLEFRRQVVPAVVVTQDMRRKIVVRIVDAASTMRENMISLPIDRHGTTAYMAPTICLAKDELPIRNGQRASEPPSAGSLLGAAL